MERRKRSADPKRIVWRMTDSAPMGELVDLDSMPTSPATKDRPEVSSGGYIESSFALLDGTEVSEGVDTLPADLFDELFAPQRDAAKNAERK
jgi:hypothetical protein